MPSRRSEARAQVDYERERDRFLSQWVRGSTRRAAVELQEAVKQEFGLEGLVWHGRFAYSLSQTTIDRLRPVARQMYEETQTDLASRGVVAIRLYRGVSAGEPVRVISSWTSDLSVARRFGGGVILDADVAADRVFMYHRGPGWQNGPFGDQAEYLVLGDEW